MNYADTSPPETTLNSVPPDPSASAQASFSFSSSNQQATFECRLDDGTYLDCQSPKSYTGITDGSHTLFVRAVNGTGLRDPSPDSYTWTIDTTAPDTIFLESHSQDYGSAEAAFRFTSSEPASTFECQLDDQAYSACTSPQFFNWLEFGQHSYKVRALDRAGNRDLSLAVFEWVVRRLIFFALVIK